MMFENSLVADRGINKEEERKERILDDTLWICE